MYLFKQIKHFTTVFVFLIGMGVGSTGWASMPKGIYDVISSYKSKTNPLSSCYREAPKACSDLCEKSENLTAGDDSSTCKKYCDSGSIKTECDSQLKDPAAEEDVASCKSAYDDYKKAKDDVDAVCGSLTGKSDDGDNSCKARYNSCLQRMSSLTTNPNGNNPSDNQDNANTIVNLADQVLQQSGSTISIKKAKEMSSTNGSSTSANVVSCVKKGSSKSGADFTKQIQTQRESIQKEIKEIQKDLLEAKKNYNETQNKIKKSQTELEDTYKKSKSQMSKELQATVESINKQSADENKKIRQILQAIDAEETKVRQRMYQYSKFLNTITQEKVKLNCKTALAVAKSCMVNIIKGLPVADDCKKYNIVNRKNYAAAAELKEKLSYINSECYSSATQSLQDKKNEIDEQNLQSQKIIDDYKKQLQDEYTQLSAIATKLKEAQTNASTEDQNALTNYQKQLQNSQEEVQSALQEYQEKQATLKQQLNDANNRLTELKYTEATGEESALQLSKGTMTTAASKYKTVKNKCKCDRTATAISATTCKDIQDDDKNYPFDTDWGSLSNDDSNSPGSNNNSSDNSSGKTR